MRFIQLLALSLTLFACRTPTERVYVSAEQSDEVVVVDPVRAQVIARIPVGKRPRGLTLSRDRAHLYVALSGSPRGGPNVDESQLPPGDRSADGVGEIDIAQARLTRTLPGGQDPETFDITPDGSALYIANEETAELSRLDLASGKITQRIAVGHQPEGVRVHPDGNVVYVACEEDNTVVAADTRNGTVLARIQTGKRPRAIAFSEDGHEAVVTNEMDGTLTVIDTREQHAVATIPIHDPEIATHRPMGIVRGGDTAHYFVTTGRGGSIAQIDLAARKLVRVIHGVGSRPWGVALSRDGKRLYTANGPSNDLTILDLDTGKLTHVPIGGSPWGVVSTDLR